MSEDFQQIFDNIASPELRGSISNDANDTSLEQSRGDGRIAPQRFPYLDKISLHIYKEGDAQKANDYSEDEIFERTISAALGAGLARLERGIALLNIQANM